MFRSVGLSVALAQILGHAVAAAADRPNVLFIVADDLGLNDVPFTGTGSEVKTPYLQRLADEGTVLKHYYVNQVCTPTRASFMSAKYPIHLGLQHGVIRDSVPNGLPLSEKIMPQVFQDAGYSTHMVGKWHLGFYSPEYTPEFRGFQEHFGYYTGNEEYWNHTSPSWNGGNYTALDFHRSNSTHFEPLTNLSDQYSTIVFAEEIQRIIRSVASAPARSRPESAEAAESNGPSPFFIYAPFEAVHGASSCYVEGQPPNCNLPDGDELQAPQKYIDEQSHIPSKDRRTFAGMVGALDEAVSNITATLNETGLLENTLIVFTTDNGAPNPHFDGATMSNYPLRAGKGTLWEGGIHGAAFVYGSAVGVPAGAQHAALMHATDWIPTLAEAVGLELPESYLSSIDGVSLWSSITNSTPVQINTTDWPGILPEYGPRTEILHNIDPSTNSSALRLGDYKLVVNIKNETWGPKLPPDSGAVPAAPVPLVGGKLTSLFNIADDPQERHDLYNDPGHQRVVAQLENRLAAFQQSAVPCRNPDPDPNAQPHPVEGLNICTPSPTGPILCGDVGIWKPWQNDSRILVV